jgi:hypothetical protein
MILSLAAPLCLLLPAGIVECDPPGVTLFAE